MADTLALRMKAATWPRGKSFGCSISGGKPCPVRKAVSAAPFPHLSGPYPPLRSALASLHRCVNIDRNLGARRGIVGRAKGIKSLGGRTAGLVLQLLQRRRKLERHFMAVRCSGDGNQLSSGGSLDTAREEGRLSKPALVLPLPGGDVGMASEGKVCIQCKHFKQIVDFKKTRRVADGRMETCRACEAVTWYKRRGKELGHLGLPVEAAWEQAKPCTSCHVTKELRDFRRWGRQDGDIYYYCRACESASGVMVQREPIDTPKECSCCKKVKPADQFYANKRNLSGLTSYCKICMVRRLQELADERKRSKLYIKRERKVCPKCGEEKSPSQFYRNAATTDGLTLQCRVCMRLARQVRRGGVRGRTDEQRKGRTPDLELDEV